MKFVWVFLVGAVVGFSVNSIFFNAPVFQEKITALSIEDEVTELAPQKDSDLAQVKQYIDSQQIDLSVNGLISYSFSSSQSNALSYYLKNHLMAMASNRNWSLLGDWLKAIESAGLADSDHYLLQGQLLMVNRQYNKALEVLFVAKNMAVNQQTQGTITKEIQSTLNGVINKFNQGLLDLSKEDIERYFLYAQQQWQEYIPISLALAQFYRSQGLFQKALDSLAFLPYDEQYTSKVDDLVSQLQIALDQLEINQQGIPLIRSGSQYLVEVQISQVNMVLLIDTGASYTSLSLDAIQRLAQEDGALSDELKKVKVNTANGTTVARVFSLPSFTLANRQAKDLSVLEVNMGEHSRSDGLLGMNFLGQFKFKIDQDNALLFLEGK